MNIFNAWKQKILVNISNLCGPDHLLFFFLYYILVSYQNIHFFGQEAQKRQYFWHLTTFHTLVVMKQWSWAWKRWSNGSYGSLLHYRHVTYQNIQFFGQEAQKRQYFFTFDHFSHSMWSSNCGHEHEEGGQMNPMVHYWS